MKLFLCKYIFSLPNAMGRILFLSVFIFFVAGIILQNDFLFAQEYQDAQSQEIADLSVLSENNFSQRLKLNLRFSHVHGNFLVFYDKNNIPVFLQYRWDAFDHESDHVKNRVQRGISYIADLTLVSYKQKIPLPLSQAGIKNQNKKADNHPLPEWESSISERKNNSPDETQETKKDFSFSLRKIQGVYVGILYELKYLSVSQTRF